MKKQSVLFIQLTNNGFMVAEGQGLPWTECEVFQTLGKAYNDHENGPDSLLVWLERRLTKLREELL